MHFPYFLIATRSSHTQCDQLMKILIIFLIGGLTIMQHVRNVATSSITTTKTRANVTSNKTKQNFNDENGFSVELPKPLLMLANRKPTANSMQALKRHQRVFSHRPTLMDVALQVSAREGLQAMTELYGKVVPNIVRNGHLLEDNHPAALLSKFSESQSETLQQEMAAYATISATKAFRKNYKYFNELARQAHTSKISLRHTALEGLCPPRDPPTCMPASARYRTHDGTCNSRRRPRWGASQMPFNRFLPPEYGDGVDSVRMSVDGGPLASSRFVSLLVHGAREGEAPVTLMTAQWGQLLDHDITSTAQPRSINGSVPSCCGNTDFHPSCFPIKVPLDDPWLAPLKVRCLEFLRSAPAQRRDCILSWREQTNQATSYIDASPIYSNSVKSSDNARVFRNGLLVFGRGNPTEDVCQRGTLATHCIRAGDGRSGEQPGLLALHHVWVGEHNRIAMELSQMNLHWSDEKIYQEARRIVGAMFQHITYREFLPIVLGREVCKLFDLELQRDGYYEGYDPKTNPTIANSFAAAAFRFGHSLVQNSYMRCDRFHNFLRNNVSLHEEFQRGDIGSPGSLHRLIRGLVNQRALKRDEFITPELTNHLFQTPGFPFGLDLAAINIQRGRDHGVPPYTAWRVPCGLTPINNWEEFANVVGPQSAHRVSHAYRSVHDIDLFVGGIAERPVVGGLVGPTFACIIAQQFSNSRKGDRFWYENGGFENSFTPAQLNSIRRVSLAQILCRSVGGGTMQPHAFIPTEVNGNERQVCGVGALAPFDLSPWIENDPFANAPTTTTATKEPDRIFNIVTTHDDKNKPLTTGTVQVVKDNKVGFLNRVHPADNKNSLTVGSSGFVQGTQVPGEIIRIDDKLDIRQKVKPVKRPTTTAKPIKGVNNKLDKSPTKLTLNVRGVTVRRPQATKHTTVIVNNVPIKQRTADEKGQEEMGLVVDGTQAEFKKTRNIQTATESMTADKKEARTDEISVEESIQLNEPTKASAELLEHKQFDKKFKEKRKTSERIHVEVNTTLVRETANEKNNAERLTMDKNFSTVYEIRTLPENTTNEQAKRQNVSLHTSDQLRSIRENNTAHLQNQTNELIVTKQAEIRDEVKSNVNDKTRQRLLIKNEETGARTPNTPSKDKTNANKKGSTTQKRAADTLGYKNVRTQHVNSRKNNIITFPRKTTNNRNQNKDESVYEKDQISNTINRTKTGLKRQLNCNEKQTYVKLTINADDEVSHKSTKPNSEQPDEELSIGRDNETATKKLEEPETNVDEKHEDKKLLTKEDGTSTTRTIIYNNNLHETSNEVDLELVDKEQTIKLRKQHTNETKRSELSTDYDEKFVHNDNKRTMQFIHKNKKGNALVILDEKVSRLLIVPPVKRSPTEGNNIIKGEINTGDSYFNSVINQTVRNVQENDKMASREATRTFQTRYQTGEYSEDKMCIEVGNHIYSKLTYSRSKPNKTEDTRRVDNKTEHKASTNIFETQQTRLTDNSGDTAELADCKLNFTNLRTDQSANIKVDDKVELNERLNTIKSQQKTHKLQSERNYEERTQTVSEGLKDSRLAFSNTKLNKSADFEKFDVESNCKESNIISETHQLRSEPTDSKKDDAQTNTINQDISKQTGNQEDKTKSAPATTTLLTIQQEHINPLTQEQTNEEQKRLKRRRTDDTSKLIALQGATPNNDAKTKLFTKTSSAATATTATPRKTTTQRMTSRQVELRQYQTRPQKLIVKGPNSDQYEIEINIRQTSQKQSLTDQQAVSATTNPYTNYPTTYKPYYGYDRYTTKYVGTYNAINKATISAINAQTRRTRPPTIIYVDDPEDQYTISTTTRAPGLFQNFITYASSGLGNFNKQQQASPHSTTNIQKEHPIYGGGNGVPSANGINQIYSTNSHYIPRPGSQTHALPAYPAIPSATSLSQVGGVVSGGGNSNGVAGVVHASSSAISTGNFGTITGVAQTNGADSTFSFNIRPKPIGGGQTQLPLPINQINSGGSYGLLSTQQNIFSQPPHPSFGNVASSAPSLSGHSNYGNANKPSSNSPFSSVNKRPQQESYYGYYGQQQKLPLQQKTDLGGFDTGQDYDEFVLARTLEPLVSKLSEKNESNSDDKNNEDANSGSVEKDNENDYDYTDDSSERSEKFEGDGYVRPEDVINTVLQSKENELRNLTSNKNCTLKPLDDNYVLPILNMSDVSSLQDKDLQNTTEKTLTIALTETTINKTNFPDIQEKHFNNDIFAIDYEDKLPETILNASERMLKTSTNVTQKGTVDTRKDHTETFATVGIAFAPIKILNKLERPDNWLMYDSPANYTRLPELPAMYEDSSAPTDEIPKPFQGLTSFWLKKIQKDKDKNREQIIASKLKGSGEPLSSKSLTSSVSGNMTLT
ncbi:uncharacterized protein [Eurosta solidaginis]|uniref:uncharacterized protein n=1 Tax=Eurosta solidaginis TaxID=178769 RepID=UPI003530B9E1